MLARYYPLQHGPYKAAASGYGSGLRPIFRRRLLLDLFLASAKELAELTHQIGLVIAHLVGYVGVRLGVGVGVGVVNGVTLTSAGPPSGLGRVRVRVRVRVGARVRLGLG